MNPSTNPPRDPFEADLDEMIARMETREATLSEDLRDMLERMRWKKAHLHDGASPSSKGFFARVKQRLEEGEA